MRYGEIMEKAREVLEERGLLTTFTERGAGTKYCFKTNEEYFKLFGFKMRMIDTQIADTSLELFGQRLKTPIMSGAISGLRNIAENPLVTVAQGLSDAGSMVWVGLTTNEELESIVATGIPVVRIIKPYRDLDLVWQSLRDSERMGVAAVGMDIDFFFGGERGDVHIEPKPPMGLKTAEELKDLVASTKLPFVLKGVLSDVDAKKALDIGAGAIVVSNHGAGIIDYCAHPLEILPEVKEVIGGKIPILADSGFRRGTDVLKALALGANGVLMGYTIVMGLAANGREGVRDIVMAMTEELRRAMTITGCKNLSEVDESVLVKRSFIL